MSRYLDRSLQASPGMIMTLVALVQAISLEKLVEQAVSIGSIGAPNGDLVPCYLVGTSIFLSIVTRLNVAVEAKAG